MSINSRRDFLLKTGLGLGAGAVSGLLPGGGFLHAATAAELIDPLAPKQPHFPAKVKSVIWLHQNGAPSTLDLFDYKPELVRLAGQDTPASFLKGIKTSTQGGVGKLYASKRTWKQHGESAAWFSDLVPNIATQADKIAFIKSSVTVGATHDISILKLNTGDLSPGRPSLGAWVSYALGTANPDLPPYVVLYNGKSEPSAGSVNWNSGFLPAVYQGTAFRPGPSPILYLERPELRTAEQQRSSLDLLKRLNNEGAARYPADTELKARVRSYELADRMQVAAPEAVDLAKESDATKELYGINDETSSSYGTTLLRARRLVERGVRFVQVVTGAPDGQTDITSWDAHSELEKNHSVNARMIDKPIAGLLADLESRGLLQSTLVVWTSEFGRTSYGQSGNGRDHNPWGYTQWVAGGGIKAGTTYGATDEIGLQVADKDTAVDTYDLHATVLQLLGLDHLKTTFLNNGRSERPTVVYGKVIKELLA
ncbi:Protein of unknown function [Duganella sp. CF402]|jgi:hypothetical protein|uniref:DUF1501 domain-containing protein n=1 Tax=unclassified Duganella TaxID=2636909 RepID=UPI0008B9742B|nr:MULTISPECIES: DUF1501 domain-containing protein [unclassified Duganella]RZT04469.1 uncharacterized protein DUF1501 [Duganella sp. BK701]SEM35356.1 Protein of unknown function [Duganella sp. CF402]